MTHRGRAIESTGDYPPEWVAGTVQEAIRERAGHCCEHCGMAFHEGTNIAVSETNGDGKPVVGTVHHLNGDKSDCRWENLLYCCQRCHLHIQALWAPGDALPLVWHNTPPDWLTARGLAYKTNPQLSLWEAAR